MKHLSILGSTGSIGRQTLSIVEMFPERFCVKALTAKNNISLLAEQITRFKPDLAVVYDEKQAHALKQMIPQKGGVEIMYGPEGYDTAATLNSVDIVIAAMVGAAGLKPTLAAIEAGKHIALANKESLVMAGEIVMKRAGQKRIDILPVDSEHSAVFQCLRGNRRQDLEKIHLTASGGPFLNTPESEFDSIKIDDALNHPTFKMGKKISIDSATLMNKGLEVIEAKHLFGISRDRIEIVIHPQSVVHSMVSYKDGSVIAQLGIPDMKAAIAYAVSYPVRLPLAQPSPDFPGIGALTFEKPDFLKFRCLSLAYSACEIGGTMPAVLNAANEAAVEAFLNKQISFPMIPVIIQKIMDKHGVIHKPELADIFEADRWARRCAGELIIEY
ncbi:1-deoxy-D-xylulose-5-phosphate reductoisomerase [Thermodesulfobacteriota bacterium]